MPGCGLNPVVSRGSVIVMESGQTSVAGLSDPTPGLPAPERPNAFLAEFTRVLPLPHIGVTAMLVPTRWWDFWKN